MTDSQTMPATEARMTEIVFPDHTNHLGTLFGGQALAWMDKAAFIAASRYARCTVVTARSEQVDFHTAVNQGALVQLVARIVATGRTSLQVEVEMHSEDLHTGEALLATRGRFTMVALNPDGRPTPVPPLVHQSGPGPTDRKQA
ncbi:acyl-CoA thioesterase [Novilysobacter antarcticus]|uniref:acyl-CoA thioesterase n=1 Tax=Novilysobacter antarcticus TaxID=2862543 RepID=UPI001C998B58|nr:acyl-CoA thioesterase [Lysobacter antarcticus]